MYACCFLPARVLTRLDISAQHRAKTRRHRTPDHDAKCRPPSGNPNTAKYVSPSPPLRLYLLTPFLCTDEIPEPILRQMTTCQTAANEFLRQFWSAMYPPRSDALQSAGGAPASAAQRATKVAKMAGYLARTPEKVEALVQRARADGVDSERVRTVSWF